MLSWHCDHAERRHGHFSPAVSVRACGWKHRSRAEAARSEVRVGQSGGSTPSSAITIVARGPLSPIRFGMFAPAAISIFTISV